MKVSRIFNTLMALFLIAAAMASAQPVAAQRNTMPALNGSATDALYVPGEVIVSFNEGASARKYPAQASALAGDVNAQVADLTANTALLSFAEDADVQALAALLASKPGVKSASPNYIGSIPELHTRGAGTTSGLHESSKTARVDGNGNFKKIDKSSLSKLRSVYKGRNVPTYPVEWATADTDGWDMVNANVIWANVTVSSQVCIIDSGADYLHPDLKGKVLPGYDFVNGDAIPNDDLGHGTHVAGIIVANNLNKYGMMGVSNGTALAVKVINSDGYGTTWDLMEALRYCGNKPAVRVINISLGGYYPTTELYDALSYAITTKNKFVVAAAGNESTSDLEGMNAYPGAWASPDVCADGSYLPACGDNFVHHGMVAVAAGNSLYDVGYYGGTPNSYDIEPNDKYWVDKDANSAIAVSGEEFDYPTCLADFSNYGAWVEMVAPGVDIYSTLPVNYYYSGYGMYGEDPLDPDKLRGYGWSSGTSMAAPFVSGAVARMLSVKPTLTNISAPSIETELITNSASLANSLAVNGGVVVGEIEDGYGATYTGEIPYCVPTAAGNYAAKQNMAASKYVDVAKAMGRTAITAYVRDATNGLPLNGAVVNIYQGTALKNSTSVGSLYKTGFDMENYSGKTELINVPNSGLPLTVKVTKPGYTTNAIVAVIPTTSGPYYQTNEYLTVSVPPLGKISLVADWDYGNVNSEASNPADLDLLTFIPQAALGGDDTVIGNPMGAGNFFNAGVFEGNLYTPLDPTVSAYRTRWYHDGGNPSVNFGIGTEAVSMMSAPGLPLNPYFNYPASSTNKYEFFLTDYGAGLNDMRGYVGSPVVVRLWRNGQPAAGKVGGVLETAATLPYAYSMFNNFTTTCDSDGVDNLPSNGNGDDYWLKIGDITGKDFNLSDTCVIGDPIGSAGDNPTNGNGLPYNLHSLSRGTVK